MDKETKDLRKYAKCVLFIGIPFILISPFLFTRESGIISFNQATGHVADTIGGLTAPVIGLISAVLVYLALRSQVRANEIIQSQIRNQKKDENQQKNFANLLEIYKQIKEDLDGFTVTRNESLGGGVHTGSTVNSQLIIHSGRRALFHLFNDVVRDYCIGFKENKNIYNSPAYRTILRSLKIFNLLTEKIKDEDLHIKDRETLSHLSKYFFESRIESILRDECPHCEKEHKLLPEELSQVIDTIKKNLSSFVK